MMRHLTLGLLAGATVAAAGPVEFSSGERQTTLVELYTSEGCSSCPPADAWLGELQKKTGLWSEFVPVAFHVDYWNYLGWKDKWSNKQFTERQRAYASAWSSENIYTPEFVVDGKEWHNWLGLRGLASSGTKVGTLKVSSGDGSHWQVSFAPAAAGASGYEVNAALLGSHFGSDVHAGENSGRHLNHSFVALALVSGTLAQTNGVFGGEFTLPAQKESNVRLGIAAWVTRSGDLAPVQAVGGWLTER